MVKVITNRAPAFLKAAYACAEADLQNHVGFVESGEKYITWDQGLWTLHLMLPERVPRFIGQYPELELAIFKAKK
jgi:hypothetical protein